MDTLEGLLQMETTQQLLKHSIGKRLGQCDGCKSIKLDAESALMIEAEKTVDGKMEEYAQMLLCKDCGPKWLPNFHIAKRRVIAQGYDKFTAFQWKGFVNPPEEE